MKVSAQFSEMYTYISGSYFKIKDDDVFQYQSDFFIVHF